jgi:hypothetical protein
MRGPVRGAAHQASHRVSEDPNEAAYLAQRGEVRSSLGQPSRLLRSALAPGPATAKHKERMLAGGVPPLSYACERRGANWVIVTLSVERCRLVP